MNKLEEVRIVFKKYSQILQEEFKEWINWILSQQQLYLLEISLQQQLQYSKLEHILLQKLNKLTNIKCLILIFSIQIYNIDKQSLTALGLCLSTMLNLQHLQLEIPNQDGTLDLETLEQFADCIKFLKQLLTLDIQFAGDIFNSLSLNKLLEGIQCLSSIKQLNIRICHFNLSQINKYSNSIVPVKIQGKCLSNLTQLESFSVQLDYGRIGDIGIEGLLEGFFQLINLKTLILNLGKNNDITQNGLQQLGNSLKGLVKLQEIELKLSNSITELVLAMKLSEGIQTLKYLQSISLSIAKGQFVSNQCIEILFKGIRSLNKITFIKLDLGNPFEIVFLGILQDLCLGQNKLQIQTIKKLEFSHSNLFSEIEKNQCDLLQPLNYEQSKQQCSDNNLEQISKQKLVYLSIFFQEKEITDSFTYGLGLALKQMQNLKHLSIKAQYSEITEQGLKFLIESLKTLNQLKKLDFQNDLLQVGEVFCYLNNLEDLSITLRQLKNTSLWFTSLKQLKRISLNINLIDSNIYKDFNQLSEILVNLTNLKELTIKIDQYRNIIQKEDIQSGLINSLPKLKDLTFFSITLNFCTSRKDNFGQQLAISIGQGLKNLINLKYLNIFFSTNNYIGEQGFQSLIEGMSCQNNLIQLSIYIGYERSISCKQMIQLIKTLSLSTSLRFLKLNLTQPISSQLNEVINGDLVLQIKKLSFLREIFLINPILKKEEKLIIIKGCKRLIRLQQL